MKRRLFLLGLLGVATAMHATAQEPDIKTPQPELPKEKLAVVTRDGKKHEFNVEMALTPQQQEIGLMFRKTVAADGGMLFDWGSPRDSMMWMRNTVSSLDMLFINRGRLDPPHRREHDAREPGDDR